MKILKTLFVLTVFAASCSDPCDDVVCQNAGTCIEGVCDCADGYEGTLCETEVRAKYLGVWSGDLPCSESTFIPTVLQIEKGGEINDLLLTTFSNRITVTATVVDSKFSFDKNGVTGDYEILSETEMNARLTFNNPNGGSSDCSGVITKN